MNPASRTRFLCGLAVACCTAAACTPPDTGRSAQVTTAYLQLLAAEDARPTTPAGLSPLLEATGSGSAFLRRIAVRALGRLENPTLVEDIQPLLADPDAAVRAEAANALAQAVHRADGDVVVDLLIGYARVETEPVVRAALARSIGRSASTPASRARASTALVALSHGPEGDASVVTLVGVALGFESLARRAGGQGLGGVAASRLAELGTFGLEEGFGGEHARVRSLAYSTLAQARRLDGRLVDRILGDADESVRLVAALHVGGLAPAQRPETIRRLLADSSLQVPLEAVRQLAGEPRTELYCRYVFAAADPEVPPAIRVLALDALARGCPQSGTQRELLLSATTEISGTSDDDWHVPAHALISIATIDPGRAAEALPRFVSHANPFVRSYAARAAALLRDSDTLRRLAADEVANIRTAAMVGLFGLEGHAVDDVLLTQLSSDDPQLLMTAARLLEGSALGASAAEALLATFERISAAERETWRDPRVALVARIGELGDARLAGRLEPYLADYDAVIARDVAEVLAGWTGRAHTAAPGPLARQPLPTRGELEAMTGAQVVLHMRSGGSIVIDVAPYEATTNVFRFIRLAERGYFDGLTFHRWAPNFVLQGGSPSAHEYQGDGPYTRDEVGLPVHWRGTVGISTRGHDTGDGQIFVNLIDNVRLDHDFTIIGAVTQGMDVVDRALEGAVIDRAEVRRPTR